MKEKKIFPGQNEGEKIIKLMNKHPFTFVRDAIWSILFFFISLVVMIFFFYVPYVMIISFLVFIFSIIGGFYYYFTWEKHRFIITDQRVISIEHKTLLIKAQHETYLDKIQDISFGIDGIWGSIFGYGPVHIQTANGTSLSLQDVYKPEDIKKMIFSLVKEKESEDNSSSEDNSDDTLMKKMAEIIRMAIKGEKEE